MLKFSVAILLSLAAHAVCAADEIGRYQAVPLPKSGNDVTQSVVVIDTKEGHLWEWASTPAFGQTPGGFYLRYQGRVRPGKTIGEVLEQKQSVSPLK
jgi:hypothetical protein